MMHPQISQRVFHTPLLAAPAKAAAFVKGLGPRVLGVDKVSIDGVEPKGTKSSSAPFASVLDERLSSEIQIGKRNGYAVKDGVAIIPVTGTLIHRGGWVGQSSGQTSYEGIGAQLDAALEDSRVRGIALEIDSYGGEVAGCFTLANRIREVRETKPVQAFVADHAFSAAYALASQADKLILPKAGGAGSIGVICLHADYSGQLESMGVAVTVISAGDHKADGSPYAPLPDDVREDMEAEMESLRLIFAESVAAGRGDRLTTNDALATEAACYLGQQAVDAGLADEVADPREAFAAFIAEVNGQASQPGPLATPDKESQTMSKPKDKTVSPEASSETPKTETQPDTSQDIPPKTPEAKTEEPKIDAVATERERIAGIMALPEAEGREDLAKSLAFNSSMSVDEAKVHLAAAPQAMPQQSLSQQMEQDDTDLDGHSEAGSEPNPVAAAMKAKYGG
ncbi:MAG: S49 family peptidase [Pelagimonas sp.]|uniref:S49 family peptidase n=1 Tax=Pelagimonas sp. TaxID=2073170 RepID=UPI003D6A1DC6